MKATSSKFNVRNVDGAEILELTRPDLTDAVYIKQLGDEIYRYIQNRDGVKLVLDFANVQSLSSAALGMVVALQKVITKQNGKLCLASITEDIHRAFKMTKLNRMITICDDVPQAVESFG